MTTDSFSPFRFLTAGIASAIFASAQFKSPAPPAPRTVQPADVAVIERFPKQPPLPEVKELDDVNFSPALSASHGNARYPDIRKPTGAQQSMAVFSKNRAMHRDLRFR